jgi:archaellum component FlaF (FlaF/FlaG flagellin family)
MKSCEPSLESIEDYNGQESKEKRKTILVVISSLLAIGILYSLAVQQFQSVDDEIPNAVDLVKRF